MDFAAARLTRLLEPRSVVVVGATDRAGSYAAATVMNLLRNRYPGRVLGVHPQRAQVLGVRCTPTLAEARDVLGGAPDAVVVATPAGTVEGYLREAGELGCGGAVVYAAGFGESGQVQAQAGLLATARDAGLPVLGPNANGFVSVRPRAPLWGDAVTHLPEPGPVALVTQSGNVGVLALAHRNGLGLHSVISLGNAAVLDAAGVLAHLAGAEGVRSVALYLEDDGDGARLAAALAACARHDVRVAVLKVGRSAAGRRAAGAHTAALAGDHRVFAALVAEAGGVLCRDPHDLIETARALAGGHRAPGGLAVLTASGGDAAIAADLAADAGVPLADLTPATRSQLRELLPHTATVANPLDHTNLVWADTAAIAGIAAVMAADAGVGTLMYVQDQPPGLPPADVAEWGDTRAGALLGAERAGLAATLVATTPGQEPAGAVSGLRSALAAVAALRRPAPEPARLDAVAAAARQAAEPTRPGEPAGWLAEHETKDLLAAAGIAVPVRATFSSTRSGSAGIGAAAEQMGFPVALKVSAAGLLHKSEAGALALDLGSVDEVLAAAGRLAARPGLAPGAVLLLEKMVPAGIELVVAARRDGVVPALVIGLGGIWAETLDDVAVVPLPADPGRVVEALLGLRAAALLTGGRGRPPVDLAAVGRVGSRLGELLLSGGFDLLEVNPLIAGRPGRAATAVDALGRRPGLAGPTTLNLS